MKKLFLGLLLLTVSCGVPGHSFTPPAIESNTFERTQAATVALVDENNRIFCSGVFISPTRVLTAAHCVEDVRTTKVATYYDFIHQNGSFSEGLADYRVAFIDPTRDLALLQGRARSAPHTYVKVGDNAPHTGDRVYLIGHPAGLGWTVTEGVVSRSNRRIEGYSCSFIQHSAEGFYGNSGGPLFNRRGEVVGIMSMMMRGASHLSFSIHSSEIKRFLSDFETFDD